MPYAFAGGAVVTNLPVDFTTECPNIALLLPGAVEWFRLRSLRSGMEQLAGVTEQPRSRGAGHVERQTLNHRTKKLTVAGTGVGGDGVRAGVQLRRPNGCAYSDCDACDDGACDGSSGDDSAVSWYGCTCCIHSGAHRSPDGGPVRAALRWHGAHGDSCRPAIMGSHRHALLR